MANLSNRSFPELREFLAREILGADYPVKHLIEQARNKGHISKGKPGRGGAKVSTRDVAILVTGALSGDTPLIATNAMSLFAALKPIQTTFGVHFPESSALNEWWWNRPLIDAICMVINAHRQDKMLDMNALEIRIIREPKFYGKIYWNDLPGDPDEFVSYELPEGDERNVAADGHRVVSVSLFGQYWSLIADWLEDRSPYCEPGPYLAKVDL